MGRGRQHDYDGHEGQEQDGHHLAFLKPGKKEECRTCVDFKTWLKAKWGNNSSANRNETKVALDEDEVERAERQVVRNCPPDSIDLGRGTWQLLHSTAANLPQGNLDDKTKENLSKLITSLSELYPCSYCAEDFRADLKKHPINLNSGRDLSKWLCEAHNRVNVKLGKKRFDCNDLEQRWNAGWKDGRCDY